MKGNSVKSTKETSDLKGYVEDMLREQKLSSQKLLHLVGWVSLFNNVELIPATNDMYSPPLSHPSRQTTGASKVLDDFKNG